MGTRSTYPPLITMKQFYCHLIGTKFLWLLSLLNHMMAFVITYNKFYTYNVFHVSIYHNKQNKQCILHDTWYMIQLHMTSSTLCNKLRQWFIRMKSMTNERDVIIVTVPSWYHNVFVWYIFFCIYSNNMRIRRWVIDRLKVCWLCDHWNPSKTTGHTKSLSKVAYWERKVVSAKPLDFAYSISVQQFEMQSFVGRKSDLDTLKGRMNQSASETRDANWGCSHLGS